MVLILTVSVLKEHLENFTEVCKFPPKADAVCRYQLCLSHTVEIYFSDPDFKVSVRSWTCCLMDPDDL